MSDTATGTVHVLVLGSVVLLVPSIWWSTQASGEAWHRWRAANPDVQHYR